MANVKARLTAEGKVVRVLPNGTKEPVPPRTDWARSDATTEEEIARQIAEDDAEAWQDAAAHVRKLREREKLSQEAFAALLQVSVETVRKWEQGKRSPRGPARTLLKLLDRAPAAVRRALKPERRQHVPASLIAHPSRKSPSWARK